MLVASQKWGIRGALRWIFFIKFTITNLKWCGRKRIEQKKLEIHRILQNLLYQYFYHSWTLSKKSTKNTSDTANYTALNTGHQNNEFHCKRGCQICFSTCDGKISACLSLAWLLFLTGAVLYCLMLWTILFYSFLFSWEFLSGLWLANLSVTSSIQSMHMQVILNVYQSAQWWLFTESNQIIIICSVSCISTCHVIDENNSVVPYCNCSKFCSTTCTVECLKNVFKCINFESVIAYLYFLG